ERMFQIQAAVLLTVEALVLNVPAMSASFRSNLDHGAGADVQVSDPGKGGSDGLIAPSDGFFTKDGVKRPGSVLVILIAQMLNPAIDLVNSFGWRCSKMFLGHNGSKLWKSAQTAGICPSLKTST